MESLGPLTVLRAEKTAVPIAGVGGGSEPLATRAPQRAQKTSTPGVTGFAHEAQTAVLFSGAASAATRPPHLGQNGSDGSTGVWQ